MTWQDILKNDEQILRDFLEETAKQYKGTRYDVVRLDPRIMEVEGKTQIYNAFKKLFETDKGRLENMAKQYFGRQAYVAPDYQGQKGVYYISL